MKDGGPSREQMKRPRNEEYPHQFTLKKGLLVWGGLTNNLAYQALLSKVRAPFP